MYFEAEIAKKELGPNASTTQVIRTNHRLFVDTRVKRGYLDIRKALNLSDMLLALHNPGGLTVMDSSMVSFYNNQLIPILDKSVGIIDVADGINQVEHPFRRNQNLYGIAEVTRNAFEEMFMVCRREYFNYPTYELLPNQNRVSAQFNDRDKKVWKAMKKRKIDLS